ncbi:microfibril-associated glycoprotein 4-like [Branchiostoma floridae]|uniref:Microfibril-associated glycoprotein 4-like n=1 Tax=Branchiostoma floridae TaxID=7739 RepID=A0A9J7MCY7_BRAFL|nr:microfibril-associated glycoprotein 4-like [Branchiostoma floridae]
MANVLLLAVFLLSGSLNPARAQDSSTIVPTTNTEALERQLAETREETGRLKNEVDRLSSLVETLLSRRCCAEPTTDTPAPPADCAAYKASGQTTSGVYPLSSLPSGVKAYCDMDTAEYFLTGGGWTVIQRRQDGSVPFNRTWEEYKLGFGDKNVEYWLGNENIHLLTNQKKYTLRVDLQDWEGKHAFAEYSTFRLVLLLLAGIQLGSPMEIQMMKYKPNIMNVPLRMSGESDGYRLHISGYSGTAGDSMDYHNNGQRFSTMDRDNDASKIDCSQRYGQGGWWFWSCSYSFLNGRYLGNCGNSCPYGQGVMWYHWRGGGTYSLKSVSMKIRPA